MDRARRERNSQLVYTLSMGPCRVNKENQALGSHVKGFLFERLNSFTKAFTATWQETMEHPLWQ